MRKKDFTIWRDRIDVGKTKNARFVCYEYSGKRRWQNLRSGHSEINMHAELDTSVWVKE